MISDIFCDTKTEFGWDQNFASLCPAPRCTRLCYNIRLRLYLLPMLDLCLTGLSNSNQTSSPRFISVPSSDNPCETDPALCNGTGQECVHNTDTVNGYECRCQEDYEGPSDACVGKCVRYEVQSSLFRGQLTCVGKCVRYEVHSSLFRGQLTCVGKCVYNTQAL